MMPDSSQTSPAAGVRRSYVRVVTFWVIVLVALYAFQEYFS